MGPSTAAGSVQGRNRLPSPSWGFDALRVTGIDRWTPPSGRKTRRAPLPCKSSRSPPGELGWGRGLGSTEAAPAPISAIQAHKSLPLPSPSTAQGSRGAGWSRAPSEGMPDLPHPNMSAGPQGEVGVCPGRGSRLSSFGPNKPLTWIHKTQE